ncbi:MAG: NTP transferase domain-containing protein [Deltaproteobacteria bacterium]|jgi:NDP-sugar pyrophosphorylase family protein|nr:NTP transferase domain-containing protein [Deltaproteobacteria bacterium]
MLPVLILAGGLGTRLGELAATIPKSLLDIAGEPFIFHQLRLLKRNEVEKVFICIGHMGDMIKETVGNGEKFGLNVYYSDDGKELLGTGGAIVNALPMLPDLFMVLYGDSYLDTNYRNIAKAFLYSGKVALMTVYKNQNQYDKSNVIFQHGLVSLYDKHQPNDLMHYIDYGICCFFKTVFKTSFGKKFDLASVLTELSAEGNLAGYEVHNRFFEIGSLQGKADLENYLARIQ